MYSRATKQSPQQAPEPTRPAPSTTAGPKPQQHTPLFLQLPGTMRTPAPPKLTMTRPADAVEQEAEHISERVLQMPEPADGAPEHMPAPPSQAGGSGQPATLPSVRDVLRSPGRPLDPATRRYMEPRFGHDFSQVRVHSDAQAAESARALNAPAYTVGPHIVFGGRAAPETPAGRRLVAHELAHVVQQTILPSAPVQIARGPNAPGGEGGLHADSWAFLEGKMRQFFELLSPKERIRLKGRSTIAIGWATVEGEPRLVYSVASNRVTKEMRAAADKLDLHLWTYETGVKGRGAVGAPNDAEQLMSGFAEDNEAKLEGIVVSRRVCPDCEEVTAHHESGGIEVRVIEDPIEMPQKAPQKPPTGTGGGTSTKRRGGRARGGGSAQTTEPATSAAQAEPAAPVRAPTTTPGPKGGTAPATEPGTSAYTGAPLEPVSEPAPFSAHGAIEGAAIMILSAQLASVRGAEAEKARARLEEITPEIQRLNAEGNNVTLTLVMEVPDQPDVAAAATGVGDPGQVVYFKQMEITNVLPRASAAVKEMLKSQDVMRPNLVAGEPTEETSYIASFMEKNQPREGFHFVSRELFIEAPAPAEESVPQRGFAGVYRPVAMQVQSGKDSLVGIYGMHRVLRISGGGQGDLNAEMLDTNESAWYRTDWASGRAGSDELRGHFTLYKADGTPRYTIASKLRYSPGKTTDFILETATGEDLDPQWKIGGKWRATIFWMKSD